MLIASASTTVKFHEFPDGAVLHNYQPGAQADGPIRSISWSNDGNWLALVPRSGPAEIVGVKERLKLLHTVQGIEEPSCAAFHNTTKKNVAVGTKGGQVFVYDIKNRSVKKRFPRASSAVIRVDVTAKDGHVVAACDSGEAFFYSNVNNGVAGTFRVPRSQSISALRTNPIKRNLVVAGSNEGVVAVWDLHANRNRFFVGSHKAPVTDVAFSPINSDLVVSTGLDRQFCFYDMGDNRCIGNIFVENSMTSVDFSPDGKFVVMGSQKGKIYVYDSKKIQQPLHSFFGHSGAVQHLSFRKNEEYESSFIASSEGAPQKEESDRNSSDSFSVCAVTDGGRSEASQGSAEAVDSFLAAMGIGENTSGSVRPEVSVREGSRSFAVARETPPNPGKLLQEKLQNGGKVVATSTPNLVTQEMLPCVSPIVNSQAEQGKVGELQDFVKDTVRHEMRVVSEELKNDLKYYSTHILAQTRQLFLDQLMFMVKESIKIENNFNELRADVVCDVQGSSQEALFEENCMLKQRIASLEEELSVLKNNQYKI